MVIAPARRAGDPGSIPGPGENFSLKLLIRLFALCSSILLTEAQYKGPWTLRKLERKYLER